MVHAHPASFCKTLFQSGAAGIGGGWEDKKMPCDIKCLKISPCNISGPYHCNASNNDDFPKSWHGSNPPASTKRLPRGEAYFFFPHTYLPPGWPNETCNCHVKPSSGLGFMSGSEEVVQRPPVELVRNKSWIVYMHGGAWEQWTPIDAGYAQLAANVASTSGMGVLSIDYRTTTWRGADPNIPAGWPTPME